MMEKSEPALVPEWLRCTGSVIGGGTSSHHFASSSSHSGTDGFLRTRNRSSRNVNDKDSPRAPFLDRPSLSNSRFSSGSTGSTKHPYSSFTRSHRDKNRDKEKDRSVIEDLWDHDSSDPLGNILGTRIEKTILMRSQSLVSRKPHEVLPQRAVDLKNGSNNNHSSGHDVLAGESVAGGIQKAAFEKDFPTLGTEEKQGVLDIGRVSSPGFSMAVQSLPVGSSGYSGGERWTSALAEVPAIIGSSGLTNSSVQQSIASPMPGASNAVAGPNMAHALSHNPSRACTTPQIPEKTQRFEELAIKQSRQLIPMTPSIPKALILNSFDKSKHLKAAVSTNEMSVAAKSVQQQPYSSQTSQSLRSGQVRSDVPKTSHAGKFLVLKSVRESGVSPMAKEVSSPTNNASGVAANGLLAWATSAPTAPFTSASTPKIPALEHKSADLVLNPRSSAEKRASLSQAQSRSDFFNLMRKKTSVNASAILPDSSASLSFPSVEKSGKVFEGVSVPVSPRVTENGCLIPSNDESYEEAQRFSDVGEKNVHLNGAAVYPDEEEAAFLRSLGWEENAGEDEGLTEEEINAFYQEYMNLRPSLKVCRGAQPKCSLLPESHASN
ncbi:unnamed protein product [Ilex paraguariensis]|uniref:Mediator of RNA polymerase II transcription subunit 1 n=1 Tax=Ilex paraguariensis TaxID=185542 RepID=A0ABC8TMJ0_9AQUA